MPWFVWAIIIAVVLLFYAMLYAMAKIAKHADNAITDFPDERD